MKNFRYIKPRINIDDCKEGYKVAFENDTVTIWLSTLYNMDYHTVDVVTDLSVKKVSDYQYELACDNLGYNDVYVVVENKDKLISNRSNSLMIIVLDESLYTPTFNLDFSKDINSQHLNLII